MKTWLRIGLTSLSVRWWINGRVIGRKTSHRLDLGNSSVELNKTGNVRIT